MLLLHPVSLVSAHILTHLAIEYDQWSTSRANSGAHCAQLDVDLRISFHGRQLVASRSGPHGWLNRHAIVLDFFFPVGVRSQLLPQFLPRKHTFHQVHLCLLPTHPTLGGTDQTDSSSKVVLAQFCP